MTAERETPSGEQLSPQRRRGAALERAILAAAYAELTEVGYRAFTVENVAARARTGKASIYRRWPSKPDLVLDALTAELPGPADVGLGPACVVGDDVTTEDALRAIAGVITRTMNSPAGCAMRAVKFEAVSDEKLAACVDERFGAPRRAALLGLLERGVARGEVRPGAATPEVADVLPMILLQRVILQKEDPTPRLIDDVIDNVMIPLVEAR